MEVTVVDGVEFHATTVVNAQSAPYNETTERAKMAKRIMTNTMSNKSDAMEAIELVFPNFKQWKTRRVFKKKDAEFYLVKFASYNFKRANLPSEEHPVAQYVADQQELMQMLQVTQDDLDGVLLLE